MSFFIVFKSINSLLYRTFACHVRGEGACMRCPCPQWYKLTQGFFHSKIIVVFVLNSSFSPFSRFCFGAENIFLSCSGTIIWHSIEPGAKIFFKPRTRAFPIRSCAIFFSFFVYSMILVFFPRSFESSSTMWPFEPISAPMFPVQANTSSCSRSIAFLNSTLVIGKFFESLPML